MLCWTASSFGAEAHPDWVNALKPKGEPGPELTLAAEGKTDYVILVPAAPTLKEKKAGEDLATGGPVARRLFTFTFSLVPAPELEFAKITNF